MPDTVNKRRPTTLLLADLGGPSARHWQARWRHLRDDCAQVDLGCSDDPIRNVWLGRIDQAVGQAPGPVVIVAHGLSALALAWWAALLGKAAARNVTGALLVAPPDPERSGADERVSRFGPVPTAMLPFPSILVAGKSDPHASLDRARTMAAEWTSDFIAVASPGHLGAGLGSWQAGLQLLDLLIEGGPGLSRYTYRPEPPIRTTHALRPAHRPTLRRSAIGSL